MIKNMAWVALKIERKYGASKFELIMRKAILGYL